MGGLLGSVVPSFFALPLPLGSWSVVSVCLVAFGGGGRVGLGRRREVLRGVFGGRRAPEEIRRRGQLA